MGVKKRRFVAKAVPPKGWRIWNTKTKRWWGNFSESYPEELLDELNGERRSEEVTKLQRKYGN